MDLFLGIQRSTDLSLHHKAVDVLRLAVHLRLAIAHQRSLNIESCSVEALEEDAERRRRGVLDDAITEEVELFGVIAVQPGGRPIIQVTNSGLRRTPPIPVLAPEVGDGPEALFGVSNPRTACRPECSVQFPATPLAFASCAVGVGRIPLSIIRATLS